MHEGGWLRRFLLLTLLYAFSALLPLACNRAPFELPAGWLSARYYVTEFAASLHRMSGSHRRDLRAQVGATALPGFVVSATHNNNLFVVGPG